MPLVVSIPVNCHAAGECAYFVAHFLLFLTLAKRVFLIEER